MLKALEFLLRAIAAERNLYQNISTILTKRDQGEEKKSFERVLFGYQGIGGEYVVDKTRRCTLMRHLWQKSRGKDTIDCEH